ncbi:MAG: isoaspartyl peptidase/L-asparaginase [Bacteroidetes bacterium]|nr:isoaspartyl peptidase/L-asparaginase [Bacteroidota bacterium]
MKRTIFFIGNDSRFAFRVSLFAFRVTQITFYLICLVLLSFLNPASGQNNDSSSILHSPSSTRPTWVLVIHGGAGGPGKGGMPADLEKQYTDKLQEVLEAGKEVLSKGGTSLDAVETCIRMMEDSPLFNAGKGAVFTEEGKNELDASIMDGKTLKAGAVAGVSTIKNPITAARAVMEKSKHVMLIDGGAEKFAKEQGLEIVKPSYFYTKKRWDEYEKVHQQEMKGKAEENPKHGTVGAVALDAYGNLAAGTSTGGMTNKMKGRIGDSPIIGAGTYANNATCAISATGHGEFFIRNVVAYDISALMEYKGLSLDAAAHLVVDQKLKSQGADGGLIGVDKNGNITLPFNTKAMFRGTIRSGGKAIVNIYPD